MRARTEGTRERLDAGGREHDLGAVHHDLAASRGQRQLALPPAAPPPRRDGAPAAAAGRAHVDGVGIADVAAVVDRARRDPEAILGRLAAARLVAPARGEGGGLWGCRGAVLSA